MVSIRTLLCTSIASALCATLPSSFGFAQSNDASPVPPAASGRTYIDSRKTEVVFPLGALSFADEVVSFTSGTPPVSDRRWSDPQRVLGAPDYINESSERKTQSSLTLGCGGELIVRFTDNALVDTVGPDLYVFEVGPAVEATAVAISVDGTRWLDVGRIAGGVVSADIASVVEPGDVFHYARLTDLRTGCGGG